MLLLSSSSLGAQLSLNCSPKLPFVGRNSFQNSIFLNLKPSPFPFSVFSGLIISRHTRHRISATAPSTITAADEPSTAESEKLRVVVKLMEKPRIVLKFIWVDRSLGLGLEQVIPGGHGTIPLGPYYFWPKKDAWDNLNIMLQTKPWISHKQAAILLNQASDIINLRSDIS